MQMLYETGLNFRAKQILRFKAEGLTNREVGDQLGLSINTIKTYLKEIFLELRAKNITHAVAIALRRGLID